MTDQINDKVQKNIVQFCQILPQHVQTWKSILGECAGPMAALCNQADQLRHVEKAHIEHMKNFETVQSSLQFCILSGIEEEISAIKQHLERLCKANQTLKNKLITLETSSLDLDWSDNQSPVIRGSAAQPSLGNLLQAALDFSSHFFKTYKQMSDGFKDMDLRCEKSMSSLEKTFKVDLDCDDVQWLIAITQYVEKGINK